MKATFDDFTSKFRHFIVFYHIKSIFKQFFQKTVPLYVLLFSIKVVSRARSYENDTQNLAKV